MGVTAAYGWRAGSKVLTNFLQHRKSKKKQLIEWRWLCKGAKRHSPPRRRSRPKVEQEKKKRRHQFPYCLFDLNNGKGDKKIYRGKKPRKRSGSSEKEGRWDRAGSRRLIETNVSENSELERADYRGARRFDTNTLRTMLMSDRVKTPEGRGDKAATWAMRHRGAKRSIPRKGPHAEINLGARRVVSRNQKNC